MTKDYIKQDLAHLLETITEQVETIYSHEKRIPQIELDLIMSNVRNLYEQLVALNKLNSRTESIRATEMRNETVIQNIPVSSLITETNTEPAIKTVSEKIAPAEVITEPEKIAPEKKEVTAEKIEILAANQFEETHNIIIPEAKTAEPVIPKTIQELKTNTQEEVVVKAAELEEKQTAKKSPKTAASLFDAVPSLGEQFDDTKTLKEKFRSAKTEKSVADKIHHQKIDDLKKAIGINEKFLFINELFEGSLASYNEHIEKINTSADVNHARSIIDSLIAKYNWSADQPIVKKFIELVERRF